MEEIWKKLVGYDDFCEQYEVSNLGRVRSLPRYHSTEIYYLKPLENCRDGRMSVMLSNRGKYRRVTIHRLVGLAFVENPNPARYKELNHKDENPQNNRADNLEWCDRKYNMNYNGLQLRMHNKQKTPVIGVNKMGDIIRFSSQREGVRNGYHVNHYLGTGKEYKGYVWEYDRSIKERSCI